MQGTASPGLELSLRTELIFQGGLPQISGKIRDEEIREINNLVLDFKIKTIDMHRIDIKMNLKLKFKTIPDTKTDLTQLADLLIHTQVSMNKMLIMGMNTKMNTRLSIKTNIKINTGGTI